jgi:signal transduction histidine kinase
LRVEIAVYNDRTETRIIDEGAGVSAEIRERLFEPFFTTKDHGTGLGLAISREITEAHGGRLYFAERDTGAAFVVELPLNQTAERASNEKEENLNS